MRGDDVGELQATLGRIGFDCGRVDGIFGPRTGERARGLPAQLGPARRRRVRPDHGACPADPRPPDRQRTWGLDPARARGADVDGPLADRSAGRGRPVRRAQSAVAAAGAGAAASQRHGRRLGRARRRRPGRRRQPLRGPRLHRLRGRPSTAAPASTTTPCRSSSRPAGGCWRRRSPRECAARIDGFAPDVRGMRLPVLRETRMPAVLVTLGDVQRWRRPRSVFGRRGSRRRGRELGPAAARRQARLWMK